VVRAAAARERRGRSAGADSELGAEAATEGAEVPPLWRSVMAVISSPLRIRAVPEIPRDAARLCNSGKSMADSPVPPRRRFVAVAVPASATSVTPDVTSVVSLNGFLPSKSQVHPGLQPGGRVPW
jgi:hypothetical protein